jgi:hypothetical protein
MKVNVLGTEYEIIMATEKDEEYLENCDGKCCYYTKRLYIEKEPFGKYKDSDFDTAEHLKLVKRHEIIHAFNNESGNNLTEINKERWVSYVAIMFPKMLEAFTEAGAI